MKEKRRRTALLLIAGEMFALAAAAAILIYASAPEPEPPGPEMYEIHQPVETVLPMEDPDDPEIRTVTAIKAEEYTQLSMKRESPAQAENPGSQAAPQQEVSEDDIELLACAIYQEAGGDYFSNETRYMVGDVILNRVADSHYPDTLLGVLTQRRQYGEFYWTGVVWPEKAASEPEAVERARGVARALLYNTHSKLWGNGYVYQAEFPQGADWIYADGIYFGR